MSKPVYMIGLIDVKDFDSYAVEYGMPVGAMFAEIGAEVIVASRDPDVIEGTPHSMRNIVLLPAPFGPSRPTISPRCRWNDNPRTASKSPKRLRTSRARTTTV